MSGERVERRLAAILAVDVAGYSRLMGEDEEGTLAALRAVRRELADPKRLTENELSDFSQLWHDGCGKTIIEAQDVEQNHSPEV
jgi:hypothetical protein